MGASPRACVAGERSDGVGYRPEIAARTSTRARPATRMAPPRRHVVARAEAARHPILQLQRTAGNAAVAGLVQRVEEPAPAGPATPMLSRGSSGPAVRALQLDLNALGQQPHLDPDGAFGKNTDAAVRFFQQAHRLVPDGIVGPFTSNMLSNERATEPATLLAPCHTPEKPGPSGAHEKALDETVGPNRGGNLLGAPGKPKVNLTLVLTNEPQDNDEAAAVGGTRVNVGSMAELKKVLDANPSIGLLAIISHGGSDGTVVVGGKNEKLAAIAAALTQRTAGSIDRIQFLGCNIGKDPGGMSTLKGQTGAGAVEGVTCFLETQILRPAHRTPSGALIRTRADLPRQPNGQPMSDVDFGNHLKQLIPGHTDVRNNPLKRHDCILGLKPGTTLAMTDPAELADLYFKRQGNLVFRFNPATDGACWNDLKFDKPDAAGCQRVQK